MLVAFIPKSLPSVFTHAMQTQHFYACDVFLAFCQNHTAFTRDDILSDIKTETSKITEGPNFLSTVLGLDRVRTVFDDFQAIPSCNVHQRIHLTRASREVNRQQCSRFRRYFLLDLLRV